MVADSDGVSGGTVLRHNRQFETRGTGFRRHHVCQYNTQRDVTEDLALVLACGCEIPSCDAVVTIQVVVPAESQSRGNEGRDHRDGPTLAMDRQRNPCGASTAQAPTINALASTTVRAHSGIPDVRDGVAASVWP